ncbi:hypothetical protein H0H93_006239 [Arthromyces matolae]|nr:hypothetical protein H0H93_006239 [Arthromyces matolae]
MCPTPNDTPKPRTTQAHRIPRPETQIAPEECLLLPEPPSTYSIVDTHTHLAHTHAAYLSKYKDPKFKDIRDFVKAMYAGRNVEAIVDVWCEAPVVKRWKTFADGALTPEGRVRNFGGMEYWFAIGTSQIPSSLQPNTLLIVYILSRSTSVRVSFDISGVKLLRLLLRHDAKYYNDDVEKDILEAMEHPRCVSWGEIGLDYHYNRSPRDVQQEVFSRQLRHAVRLGKTLTIHTREANADTERILKAEVPANHKVRILDYMDNEPDLTSPIRSTFIAFRTRLDSLNDYLIISPISTSESPNTSAVVSRMASRSPNAPLRIVLETDAPFMTPSNIYDSPKLKAAKGKLPISHTAMIPWTAAFVARTGGAGWTVERVMRESRENARILYGI